MRESRRSMATQRNMNDVTIVGQCSFQHSQCRQRRLCGNDLAVGRVCFWPTRDDHEVDEENRMCLSHIPWW